MFNYKLDRSTGANKVMRETSPKISKLSELLNLDCLIYGESSTHLKGTTHTIQADIQPTR